MPDKETLVLAGILILLIGSALVFSAVELFRLYTGEKDSSDD